MSRLQLITKDARQSGRKLLIPYLVAGDPNKVVTIDIMHDLVKKGADIIELGIPFSDPSSDCLLYTSPSPRDGLLSRMPSSA